MKNQTGPAQERPFNRVLADIRQSRGEESPRRLHNPAAGATFPFVENGGGEAPTWRDAADAFVDQDEPQGEFDLASPDSPEAIALELGLDRALGEEELSRARRRFMWRNHPDRCNEAQRGLADRRVAIANMLIDRARAKLAAARRRQV